MTISPHYIKLGQFTNRLTDPIPEAETRLCRSKIFVPVIGYCCLIWGEGVVGFLTSSRQVSLLIMQSL